MAEWPPDQVRATIDRQVASAIDAGGICGAVLATGRGGYGARWYLAAGQEEPGALHARVPADAIYDLASLTKVMATLPVVLVLIAAGQVRLDDPVKRFLSSFRDAGRDEITVRQLLSHTSGLPATRRYYLEPLDPAGMRAAVLAEQPLTVPGAMVTYSDIGFLLLGFLIEAVCGASLRAAARELIFEPLGMTATDFTPDPAGQRFMPTESLDGGAMLRGVVHDRNAKLLGGIAGHAGLFATARDVAAYLQPWAGAADPPWGPEIGHLALRRHTPPQSPARGLGWVLTDQRSSSLLRSWPAGAAGHTGFTGTSVAFHPASQAWVVLLTNAIRCGRDRRAIAALRKAVHHAIARAITTDGGEE